MAASEEIVDELLKQHDFDRLQILLGKHLAPSGTESIENGNGSRSVAPSDLPPGGASRSPAAEQRPPWAPKAPVAKADVTGKEKAKVKPPPVSRRTVRIKGGFVPPPPDSEISSPPQAAPLQITLSSGSEAQVLKAPAPLPINQSTNSQTFSTSLLPTRLATSSSVCSTVFFVADGKLQQQPLPLAPNTKTTNHVGENNILFLQYLHQP